MAEKKSGGTSGGRGSALQRPVQPDDKLGAVVGNDPQPRTEITKKIWDYIKANNLQDSENRRMINADDKLRPIFGGKGQVSMFEMTKLVNEHIKK
ncbi:MAG TPA: SWIB/MDM2 domain-containing protein [Thermoanaerobaculia bacterium]|nr:SWIB/MDM2 domain-containing protein [Thermoanaerobaculia bacterium]